MIPAALHYGVGIIPWSPLMRGLLGGILAKQRDTGRSASETTQSLLVRHHEKIERYEALCSTARRASFGRRARMADPAAWGHRADRRSADHRAVPEQPARARRSPRRRGPGAAGRDLSRSGAGSRGLGLVATRVRRRRRTCWLARSGPPGPSVKNVAVAEQQPEDHQAVDAQQVRGKAADDGAERAASGQSHRVERHERRSIRTQALRAVGKVGHRGGAEAGKPDDAEDEERQRSGACRGTAGG